MAARRAAGWSMATLPGISHVRGRRRSIVGPRALMRRPETSCATCLPGETWDPVLVFLVPLAFIYY